MNNIETWFTIDEYIGTTLTKVDPTVNNIQKIINSPTLINDLSLNASRFCEHNIEYRWDSIAEKYLNI